MRFLLLVTFYFSSLCAAFAQQQAVITGDEMLCPNGTGNAMVQGIVPYDSYQWQKKAYGSTTFVNVAGATSSTFTYDAYNYSVSYIRCQVSQNGETFFSNELFIDSMVFLPPFFSTETEGEAAFDPNTGNYVICPGGQVINMIMNVGNVQWFKNGVAIPGANTATLVITEPGEYYANTAPPGCPGSSTNTLPIVVVYNPSCAPVDVTPVIAGDLMLCPGGEGTAEVTNETVYDTYQWQVKAYGETEFTDVDGETQATFTYDQYTYSVTDIRVEVTLDGETYYSNALAIDGIVFAGLLVEHTANGQVTVDNDTGAFLLCGDAASVSNTVLAPYTIVQWYKDGVAIEGATQTTYVAMGPGVYHVVASPAACPDFSQTLPAFTLADDPECTAGIDQETATAFALYPNPAGNAINLNLAQNTALESYTIIDVTGKTLMSGTLNGAAPSINIEGLATGSYIIKATGQNVQATKMFVKQ